MSAQGVGGALTHDRFRNGPADAAAGFDLPGAASGPLRLGPVFQRSPVAMAVVDGAGRMLAANEALGDYLGLTPAGLVGSTLYDHVASDDLGRLRTGDSERRLLHARGHDLWAVISVVPMP